MRRSRVVVKRRSNNACEARVGLVCNTEGCHAHHVVLRSRGGSDEPDNLLWVCLPCHAWIHDNPSEATALGFMASASKGNLR